MNEHETLLSDGDWTTSVPRPDNQTWQNPGPTSSIFPTQRIQSMLATIDEFAGESQTSEGQLSTEFPRQSKLQKNRETNITQLVQTNQTLAAQLERLMSENKSLRGSLKMGQTGTQPSRKSELLGESGFSFAADELVAHGSGVLLKNPASDMQKPPRPQRNAPNESFSEDRIIQQGSSTVKVKAFQDSDVQPAMPNKSNTSNATAEIRSVLELTESQHKVEQLESQNRMLKDSLEAMAKVQEDNNELSGKVMSYQQKISKMVSEHQEELNRQQAKFTQAEQERIKTLNSLVQLLADHKAQHALIEELKSKVVPSPVLQVEPMICLIVEPTRHSNTYPRETPTNSGYGLHEATTSNEFQSQPRIHLLGGPKIRRTGLIAMVIQN